MKLSIIVAAATNNVIGRGNDLPWHLSADLRRFKRLTMGHHLLLGRKTFEAIGKPLPGRSMIVVSRGRPTLPEGVALAPSLDAAIELARSAGETEAFVAGGSQIYRLALPRADRLYLTRIHRDFDGDAVFEGFAEQDWRLVKREDHPTTGDSDLGYTFLNYERR
jgi:dihydrofolate reductase